MSPSRVVSATTGYVSSMRSVLSQKGHPLAFVSRALGPRNKNIFVYEKEHLAILVAVEQWRSCSWATSL
jgi:hypothetical protein